MRSGARGTAGDSVTAAAASVAFKLAILSDSTRLCFALDKSPSALCNLSIKEAASSFRSFTSRVFASTSAVWAATSFLAASS